MTLTKESFEKIYRSEENVKTKERKGKDVACSQCCLSKYDICPRARDLHRNRTGACVWLKRYDEEGVEGLKNKPRTGRPPSELSEESICSIKKQY